MKSGRKKGLIALLVIVILSVVVGVSLRRQGHDTPLVQVEKIHRRPLLEARVTANGEIRPRNFFNLTAEVPGRVIEIYVKEGDVVKAGTPLLKIDPTQLSSEVESGAAQIQAAQADYQNALVQIDAARNNVLNVQASLAAARYDLERARSDLAFAEEEYKRQLKLLEEGITSRSNFERVQSNYRAAQALVQAQQQRVNQLEIQHRDAQIRVRQAESQARTAEARIRQLKATYRSALDRLQKTEQKAPIDGVITSLPVRPGQFVLASFQTTPLLTIADMVEINVEVQVDETDITSVRAGQKAKIKVDALSGQELEGVVSEVGRAPIPRPGQELAVASATGQEARDFKVVIRLVNLAPEVRERLRPGMSATATITTDARENVIAVPQSALVEREPDTSASDQGKAATPSGKKTVTGVFVVRGNRAVFTPVETGIAGEMDVEIVRGLEEGMEVIVGPYRELRTLKNNALIKKEIVSGGK